MPIDAVVHLDRLRCIREGDRSGHSEPYAWTALFWIDEEVFRTHVLGVYAPSTEQGYRTVIKSGMRKGDEASMPSAQRRLVHRFGDSGIRRIGVVVAMLEEDEFPNHVVRSAYRSFLREFPRVVGEFVATNFREPDDHERDELIRQIKRKVLATVKDALTAWEKAKDFLGIQDRDDLIDFTTEVLDVGNAGTSDPFTLDFQLISQVPTAWDPDSQLPTAWTEKLTQHYQIEGSFEFRNPPPPDPCQAEIDRVNRAQSALTNTQNLIRSLQADLHDVPSSQKPHITAEIRQHQQELPRLEADLASAHRALDACRSRQPGGGGTQPPRQPPTPPTPPRKPPPREPRPRPPGTHEP